MGKNVTVTSIASFFFKLMKIVSLCPLGGTSLDSRLASLIDRNKRQIEMASSTYTPPISRSFSTHSTHSKSSRGGDDDGSTTPLDDEAPTTPVQDENSSSPPKRPTPPKKENPIDFLSRLISQSKGSQPVKSSGASDLLDSFTMLSNAAKTFTPQTPSWNKTTDGVSGGGIASSSASQPSSPITYQPINSISPQPVSPSFSVPPPTMVPAPIPLPVPPPPPITSLNPPPLPPNLNLSVPPPPPPPFSISRTVPPPAFPIGTSTGFQQQQPQQQTSPGQKENWPESADLTGSNRILTSTHSVLKELTPAKSFESIPSTDAANMSADASSLIDPDAMEIVSDDDEDLINSPVDSKEDGLSEFATKLKQKTSGSGPSGLKSHVFVPNMERPNLVTLATSDNDKMDVDLVSDDSSTDWTLSKLHKSKKSRSKSRSRSRSRERSHKHKKKKKHKRKEGDEDDYKMHTEEIRSVVKRQDSRSSSHNSRDSKGDRFEDRGKHGDKYDKYDRYDDRRHRHDYRMDTKSPHSAHRDTRYHDIEEYTQAFIQQYSQARYGTYGGPPPSIPQRRSSYNKY